MSSIDKRIVQMQFDNQGFERGVSTTMKSLDNLNESLKMKGSAEGLNGVNNNLRNLASIGLTGLSSGVDVVTGRFSALGIIGMTALMNITNSAVNAGKTLVRSLTTEPITAGFSEYETKMNAIQTILTNTASKGTTMEDVTATLNELNKYADQTIYNFAEMTRNIGTFTAAGIDLETSATAIKGIANLAAGSGSNAQQASTAMYQLSQALAAGKVSLMDWNSVVNAGMGGELFQNALKETAKEMGIYVDKSKPFRETLQDGWLTADVLTKTLTKFAEDESLLKAATEVKTFTQLLDTMKESVQSGWATSWEYIIGDKEQAASFFTAISDGFNKMIQPSTDARNSMLKFWNENGGRESVIKGLSNVVESFSKVMRGLEMAWDMVIPPLTGEKLVEISKAFEQLTEKFKITDQTAGKIGAVFKGLLDGIMLVKDGIVSVFKGLPSIGDKIVGFGSSLLDTASNFGGFLSGLRESAAKINIFDTITQSVSTACEYLGGFILNLKDNVSKVLGYISELNFQPFFDAISNGFKGVYNLLKPIFQGIGEVIGSVNMDTFFNALKGGLLIQVVGMLKGVFDEIKGVGESAGGFIETLSGIGGNISDALGSVKDALESYQKDLNANMLIKISAAIAILAGSLLLISSIDPERLAIGLAGLSVVIAELVGSFLLMQKTDLLGVKGGSMTTFFLTFSTSILILAAALKTLSSLSPEQLMTGILGLTVTMGLAIASAKMMSKHTGKFTSAATGLVIFGAALYVMGGALEKLGSIDADVMGSGLIAIGVLLAELALFLKIAKFDSIGVLSATGILIMSASLLVLQEAVSRFGKMDPDTIIKGLASIAGVLAEIALFANFSGGGLMFIAMGTGLAIMGVGLRALADVMKSFGDMKWKEIGKGLTALAGGLTLLAAASIIMGGPWVLIAAAGLAGMSASLYLLVGALKLMGDMSWGEIGRSMVVLAGSLTLLTIAMVGMTLGVVGAMAMMTMAKALAIFTPQLLLLSQLSLGQIGIALLALAGAFTVLGVAGLLLTPVLPGLLGLAGVIVLLGVGAAACGAGLALVGAGVAAIGVAVGGSGLLIVEFLRQLINLLPQLGTKMGEMVVSMAVAIGNGASAILTALEQILMALLQAIQNVIPKIIEVATDVVIALAEGLARGVPAVVTAALELVKGVLQGIADNIQGIVEAGADCVIAFMDGLANKLPDVIESGINLALSFIEGVADGLTNNQERMGDAVRQVIEALLTTGVEVITGGVEGFLDGGKELLQGLVDGIEENWPKVKDACSEALEWAKDGIVGAATALWDAGCDVIQGFIDGMGSKAMSVINKATEVCGGAVQAVMDFLGINSPSRVFIGIGKYTAEGMAVGLDEYAYMAENSASAIAEGVLNNVKNPLSNVAKILNDDVNVNPTIRPVMDLSNVQNGARLLNDMINDQDVRINARSGVLAGTVGQIQNRTDNSDVIAAIKDLKDGLNTNGPSYTINGITYDDGSNVTSAVEALIRAARIERRI